MMIFQALLVISSLKFVIAADTDSWVDQVPPLPCPEIHRLSIEEVGCTSGLMVSTASSDCFPVLFCDDSTKVLALQAEQSELYHDVFLCCPANLDDILKSPHNEEECTTKCKFQEGMASVGNWVDGTCECSLSAFGQCDPFGEVAQGYSTCQRYFNTFGEDNCNYNLKSHQLCANEDFDYDGNYIQIRDLCPDQCVTVAFEEDSLDETVIFDLETGEAVKLSNDRRRLSDGYRYTYYLFRPHGAMLYEHKDGKGNAWFARTSPAPGGCCGRTWPWESLCSGSCRTSNMQNLVDSANNKISSLTLAPGCNLFLYDRKVEQIQFQGLFGPALLHSSMDPYLNFRHKGKIVRGKFLHTNVKKDNKASSFYLQCAWD